MDHETLVRMANQIAEALSANPDRASACRDLAEHLKRFWEPRMRSSLQAVADNPIQASRLSPLVIEALKAL